MRLIQIFVLDILYLSQIANHSPTFSFPIFFHELLNLLFQNARLTKCVDSSNILLKDSNFSYL